MICYQNYGRATPEIQTESTAVVDQCNGKKDAKLGVEIHDNETLYENLEQNCIPKSIIQGTVDNYSEFLNERKKTISEKINTFYRSL